MNTITKSLTILLTSSAAVAFGQQQSPAPLSLGLQQAIDLGLKNRYDVQSKQYDIAKANSEVQKSKKEWIPEVSGSGNMRYSPQIQSTYIPGGFFDENPKLVALGANSTAVFGLDLNQPIYKPGITTDIKLANVHAALAQEQVKEEENDVKEQIIYAYLNVVLKDIQRKVAANEEQRYQEYTSLAEGRYRLGTMLETDYLKAKLDYENAKVETQKANQNYELALINVKYKINIDPATPIVLTDSLSSSNLNLDMGVAGEEGVNNRTEIRQLRLQQESNRLEIGKQKQYALPSLYLSGNYSRQFTYKTMDLSLPQWWSSFNYVGLRLSVPITSNLKNHHSIEQARTRATQTDLNLQQKIADVNYEIQKAQTELTNARQNMQTTKDNYDLSKVIYENQRQQYDLGSKQYNDLLETNRSLNQAEQNYIKAIYDYLVANVSYQKAIGVY